MVACEVAESELAAPAATATAAPMAIMVLTLKPAVAVAPAVDATMGAGEGAGGAGGVAGICCAMADVERISAAVKAMYFFMNNPLVDEE